MDINDSLSLSDLARSVLTTGTGGKRLLLSHHDFVVDAVTGPVTIRFLLDNRVLQSADINATLEFVLQFIYARNKELQKLCAIEMKSPESLAEPIQVNFVNWHGAVPQMHIPAPFMTTNDTTILNLASGAKISFDMTVNGVNGSENIIIGLNLWYKEAGYEIPKPVPESAPINPEDDLDEVPEKLSEDNGSIELSDVEMIPEEQVNEEETSEPTEKVTEDAPCEACLISNS